MLQKDFLKIKEENKILKSKESPILKKELNDLKIENDSLRKGENCFE